jgi:hypothetical protein
MLSRALVQMTSLCHIDLQQNALRAEGLAALVPAVSKLRGLQSLKCVDVDVGEVDAPRVTRVLSPSACAASRAMSSEKRVRLCWLACCATPSSCGRSAASATPSVAVAPAH